MATDSLISALVRPGKADHGRRLECRRAEPGLGSHSANDVVAANAFYGRDQVLYYTPTNSGAAMEVARSILCLTMSMHVLLGSSNNGLSCDIRQILRLEHVFGKSAFTALCFPGNAIHGPPLVYNKSPL